MRFVYDEWRTIFMHTLIIVLLILDCIALVTVVLLQEGKSNGLSGAISGGAEQLFGKQSNAVLIYSCID